MTFLSRWLFLSFVVAYLVWLISHRTTPSHGPHRQPPPFVEDDALTVVLPVIQSTLTNLDTLLAPFHVPSTILYEVAVVCPSSLVSDVRRKLLSNATRGHPKVSLYPWPGVTHHYQAVVETVARINTQWVLVLDEHGLQRVSECERSYLLHPRAVHLPVGPHGFAGSPRNWSRLPPSDHVQPAAFLVPPFVAPSYLLERPPPASPPPLFWPTLGTFIAKSTLGSFGGIVIGTHILDRAICIPKTLNQSDDNLDVRTVADLDPLSISSDGFVILAFPIREDLRNFVPATCKLSHQGYTVLAYVYDDIDEPDHSVVNDINCAVPYFQRSTDTSSLSDWLASLGFVPDIVIGLDHQDLVSSTFSLILALPPFLNTTLIRLPRRELPYTEWIGTLTLDELRRSSSHSLRLTLNYFRNIDWNVPEVTLSVITNNRSRSLRRLFESIQRTLFYGDKVNIRINMDQGADPETLQIAYDFEWFHGDVFLHHRVIHGGLLPAVVESWYPHCNDSYGLLLEDDVELSPLAYAWIKMTLLHYKYGVSPPSASRLFGISLYQQNLVELRPTGRQPFNARTLFRTTTSADPSTPYLSQIPCSWGALYFPSPWREFHDYLSLRLTQPAHSTVIPRLRSNRWTKSWKKYFIELVYLRGYVMLYPNYDDYVSLSTNHLEVGSHVRDEPGEVYARKKRLFELPLMRLSAALAGGDPAHGPGLLDLPGGALPDWDQLPVLDLVGEVASVGVIEKRGLERRAELDACIGAASLPASLRDLLCHIAH